MKTKSWSKSFIISFIAIQLLILLLNFEQEHLFILFLINIIFALYIYKRMNVFICVVVFGLSLLLSAYVGRILSSTFTVNSQLLIINDPSYLETINQLRGSSSSVFGKLFFSKLTYFYFYLKNIFSYFDLFYWISSLGIVTFGLFIISIYKDVFKLKLSDFLFIICLLLPLGLGTISVYLSAYLLFVPFISFVITRFILNQKVNMRVLFFCLLIIGAFLQYLLPPIEIIL